MFGCVLTVLYEDLIVKVGNFVRKIWWSRTRGGVGDGDAGVRVGMDSMRIVARECNLGLYVAFSLCELILRECVTCIFAGLCRCDAVAWELEARFLCVSAGCVDRLHGAIEELWARSFRLVVSWRCSGVGCVMGVLKRSQGKRFGRGGAVV